MKINDWIDKWRRRLGHVLPGMIFRLPFYRKLIIDQFHHLYYGSSLLRQPWAETTWLGKRILKNPLDLWIYQEILSEVQPDTIIETGTFEGGSALFLASICDLLGYGKVISIDLHPQPNLPVHQRIRYVTGSSVGQEIMNQVSALLASDERVLVVLDSNHTRDHVFQELRLYSQWVSVGSYLIVEDTNINGHPAWPGIGAGPMEAVRDFLAADDRFVPDPTREKHYMTFNPGGYLKRVR